MKYFTSKENDYITALYTIANHKPTNPIEAIMQVNAFTLLDTMEYIGVEATIDGKVVFDKRVTSKDLFEIIHNIKVTRAGKISKILAVNLITGEILHSQSYDSTQGGVSFDFYVADALSDNAKTPSEDFWTGFPAPWMANGKLFSKNYWQIVKPMI